MVISSLIFLLSWAVATRAATQMYFGLIVGSLDKGDMSEEVIENILQEHASVKSEVLVRAVKPAYDQVFDFVMKMDVDSDDDDGGQTQEALKERSGVKFLESLLEANNGLMLELVMSEDQFGKQ